jgi:hypothetical protein
MTTTAVRELETPQRTTPDLLGSFVFRPSETPLREWVPMSDEERSELLEELVAWSKDPQSLDWDYIDAQD